MKAGEIFYVLQRPASVNFFDARTGKWCRVLADVRHYSSVERAMADAEEWDLCDMAVIVPYRITCSGSPIEDRGHPDSATGT